MILEVKRSFGAFQGRTGEIGAQGRAVIPPRRFARTNFCGADQSLAPPPFFARLSHSFTAHPTSNNLLYWSDPHMLTYCYSTCTSKPGQNLVAVARPTLPALFVPFTQILPTPQTPGMHLPTSDLSILSLLSPSEHSPRPSTEDAPESSSFLISTTFRPSNHLKTGSVKPIDTARHLLFS